MTLPTDLKIMLERKANVTADARKKSYIEELQANKTDKKGD